MLISMFHQSWLSHIPKSVIAKNFQVDESVFSNIPESELYIFHGVQDNNTVEEDAATVISPYGSIPTPYSFHFSRQTPQNYSGGSVKVSIAFAPSNDMHGYLTTQILIRSSIRTPSKHRQRLRLRSSSSIQERCASFTGTRLQMNGKSVSPDVKATRIVEPFFLRPGRISSPAAPASQSLRPVGTLALSTTRLEMSSTYRSLNRTTSRYLGTSRSSF